jgi:hypothetical protein
MTFILGYICAEYGLRILLAKNEGTQPLTFEIQRICAEYRIENCLSTSDEFRVLYTAYSVNVLTVGPKYDSRQVKSFVFWRSTCIMLTE